MIAVIGDSQHVASIALHRAAGFNVVGMLAAVGFKFGRWFDTVLCSAPWVREPRHCHSCNWLPVASLGTERFPLSPCADSHRGGSMPEGWAKACAFRRVSYSANNQHEAFKAARDGANDR
jgi:hypothetical protein